MNELLLEWAYFITQIYLEKEENLYTVLFSWTIVFSS